MAAMTWIMAIGISVFWLTIVGLIMWKVYEVIKFLIETAINLHDLGND